MAICTSHEIIEYDISGSMEADAFSGELHKVELVRFVLICYFRCLPFAILDVFHFHVTVTIKENEFLLLCFNHLTARTFTVFEDRVLLKEAWVAND